MNEVDFGGGNEGMNINIFEVDEGTIVVAEEMFAAEG